MPGLQTLKSLVLFMLLFLRNSYQLPRFATDRTPSISDADKFLHVYGLPVGQGDSYVIQCPEPSGELTILDMGSSDAYSANNTFWKEKELRMFLNGSFHLVRNIIISHNHDDHYNFIPKVFKSSTDLKGLETIYISCNETYLHSSIVAWINKFNLQSKIQIFNDGQKCGPNGIPCGRLNVCPKLSKSLMDIEAEVLAINWGQQCGGSNATKLNKNTDALVVSFVFNNVKLLMSSDFEDFTKSEDEKGPQYDLVTYYGSELSTPVYQIAHHGAENLANKPIIRNATQPLALFVSSNPFYSHRHPRCNVIDAFVHGIKSVCKPKSKIGDKFYCGVHPLDRPENAHLKEILSPDCRLQKTYVCGELNGSLRNVTDNEYAIYTTVPDNRTLNIIEYITDGFYWGFINNFLPRY